MTNVINEIKQFVSKKSRIPMEELSDTTKIYKSGLLSSIALLELITYLEKSFKIEIEGNELIPKNYEDIQTLACFIESKITIA
jgi:acyl carrier protein